MILIVIACLLKKKPGSKDVKAPPQTAPVPAQAVKSPPVVSNTVDSKQAGKIDVSQDAYMRMIKENCAKAGLDPNKLLADCNGNKELAFQRSNVATISRKG